MIPLASPQAQYEAHKDGIRAALDRVLDSGGYILGKEVASFERAFAEFCTTQHAIGVNSGTDALILALKALGAGPGDEVITVSHTAIATVAAVLATGATPVLVDVDPVYYTLDPARLEAAFTPRTKAVIAVHLYGQAADMNVISTVARQRKVAVIEDCAQSVGGRYRGRVLGSIGDLGCFSFYPTKNLGALGDGGMVVTSDAGLAERVRRLRQYGWNDARETSEPGLNSRLDPLQAAVLGVKLPHLAADNARRAAIAALYAKGLAGLPLTAPAVRPDSEHVFHLYVVTCSDRDGLMKHLAAKQIGSGIHYALPAHRHPGYAEKVRLGEGGLPVTEKLVAQILSLPMYPELADGGVLEVIAAVRGFFA